MTNLAAQALSAARTARDPEVRFGHLITAWRRSRDPALAELIERHLEVLASRRPAVGSATGSFQQAWLKRAATLDPVELGPLLASIARGTGPHCQVRIEALAAFGPNPVIARVMTGWLTHAPFEGKNRLRCLGPALEVLRACEDPRSVPALMKAVKARTDTVKVVGLKNWRALQALANDATQWAPPEQLPLDGLEPPTRERRADLQALWADVFAAPDNVHHRLVLADALQEQGDPRGELMSLQLARGVDERPTKRERELLAQYGEEWMGPLALALRSPEYQGGLLVGASVKLDRLTAEQRAQIVAHDAWGAVKRLDFRPSLLIEDLLGNPRANRLESLTGLSSDLVLPALESGPVRTWKLLHIEWADKENVWAQLERLEAKLPALEVLALQSSKVTRGCLRGPLGARLKRLGVYGVEGLAALYTEARGADRLERLVIEFSGLSATIDLRTNRMRVFHEWSSDRFEVPKGLSHIELIVARQGDSALSKALKGAASVTETKGRRLSMVELLREP